jgi:fatty-acyl-CoA synthase
LLGETIGVNFDRIVDRFGDRDALIDQPSGRRWSYRRLAEDVERVAAGLLERGIGKGDRVGVWAPSSPEWFMVQYATAKIGAILVPINPAYRQQELQYVLNHAEIRLVVSAERFKTSDYRAMLDAAAPETPSVAEVIYLEADDWEALLRDGRAALARDAGLVARAQDELSFDDPINIQYISGTTGSPKGATCRTTRCSTTGSPSARSSATPSRTGSACRCRSTTASGW